MKAIKFHNEKFLNKNINFSLILIMEQIETNFEGDLMNLIRLKDIIIVKLYYIESIIQ